LSESKTEIEPKNQTNEVAPFEQDFDRLMQRFEDEFESFWGTMPRWRNWMREFPMMPSQSRIPSVDLEDRGKDFRVTADLPAFKKEDVEIEITDDSLTLQAKKTQTDEEKNKKYIRRERTAQTFYRRIAFPERINSDAAQAKLIDGTLEVILPKKEPKAVKKLPIT
jgi:HSP20 family protein